MDLVDPNSSQIPPLWPTGPVAYAIDQLRIEFPFTDTRQIGEAVHRATGTVSMDQGPMMILRTARELLRRHQKDQESLQTRDFRQQESA